MSTTLRWQDVAGQVRAPDFSDSAQMITRGIEGLGAGVQSVLEGPEKRRQAQVAKEMAVLQLQADNAGKIADNWGKLSETVKTDRKEKDMKEWGTAQSTILAGARQAALEGKPYDDFLNSEAYLKLGEGARAYGAADVYNAFTRGDEFRAQRQEQAADNARQERFHRDSMAQQQRAFAQSAANADRDFRLREQAANAATREKLRAAGIYSNDANTNVAIKKRASEVGRQVGIIEAASKKYGSMTPAEAAKASGLPGNWFASAEAEAQKLATEIQRTTGKTVQPWMVNQLLATGGGADNARFNPGGGLDDDYAKNYLMGLLNLEGAARQNHLDLTSMITKAEAGSTFSAESMARVPLIDGTGRRPAAPKAPAAQPPAYREWTDEELAIPEKPKPAAAAQKATVESEAAWSRVTPTPRGGFSERVESAERSNRPVHIALKNAGESVLTIANRLKASQESLASYQKTGQGIDPTPVIRAQEKQLEKAMAKMAAAQLLVDELSSAKAEPQIFASDYGPPLMLQNVK